MQPTRTTLPTFTTRAALIVALTLTSAPALAQATSDAQARDELAFARGLASEWGFVGLAEEVLADLEAAGISEKLTEELGLVKCEVYFEAAKNNRDQRRELLGEALESYQDFIDRNAFSDLLPRAEAGLIQVASYYSRYLASELEDAVGDEAEELRAEMQGVLDTAIEKTGDLIGGLKAIPPSDRTEADKRQLNELLFSRGEMLLEMAKTQEDGAYSFESSFRAFEELVTEAGESSPWGLRAFVGLGDNLAAQGEYGDASAYYEFVVEMAITRDKQAWDEAKQDMTQNEKQQRFLFVQMATPGLVESLTKSGETADAANWGLHFYNLWKSEGLSLEQPMGYLALLSVARTLVDAGGVIGGSEEAAQAEHPARRDRRGAIDMALSMAQTVNRENRGTTLQLHAQTVISEIISRPGIPVDPETLFEAAQGQYYEKDFAAAVDGFKRVLSALEGQDSAKQQEIGPKTLWHIGRSFQQLDRDLEAAVVYREAVAPDSRWRGDPQYDEQNAQKFYEAMRALKATAPDDELYAAWWRDAENWAKELTSNLGAEVAFRDAYELYVDQQYEEAKAGFGEVTQEAESYEKAMVFVGVSDYKLGNLEAADEVFDTYINEFLTDPVNSVNDPRKRAKRSEAEATAWYYWGLSKYKQAEETGDWDEVLSKLADFHKRFPEQDSFAPAALYRSMIAHTKKGDNKSARAVYEEMLEVFGDSQWTGKASTDYYKILKQQQKDATDEERKRALLVEMAEALQVLNSTSANPSFNNMRSESRHWMDLGEYARAEALLKRIQAQFSETEAEDIEKFVLPDLGAALAAQYKVQEAADVLAPLVDAKRASRDTARIYAHTLIGWLETEEKDGQTVVMQIKGVGGAENFAKGTDILNQITEATEKWENPWYDLKSELIFGYHQWGSIDGKKLDTARSQIEFLITNLGSQFKNEKIAEPLRQKYLWLAKELK